MGYSRVHGDHFCNFTSGRLLWIGELQTVVNLAQCAQVLYRLQRLIALTWLSTVHAFLVYLNEGVVKTIVGISLQENASKRWDVFNHLGRRIPTSPTAKAARDGMQLESRCSLQILGLTRSAAEPGGELVRITIVTNSDCSFAARPLAFPACRRRNVRTLEFARKTGPSSNDRSVASRSGVYASSFGCAEQDLRPFCLW